ncbi:hypothetical protein [Roseomonas fluvialis]|uniref:Uncharacterized protein n=1 Tax=Roseomonas fluvialis TaxID=1750527 RepID=A0ABN6P300_9PROT|nr:hypothetical protein [Roseomonas fluvialis]BDG73015.1 hypothetical protein Rmf_29440 [Roseomonas fluvialis]
MRLRLALLPVLLVAALPAAAQTASLTDGARVSSARDPVLCRAPDGRRLDHWALLARTLAAGEGGPRDTPVLPMAAGRYSAASSGSLRMEVMRASTVLKEDLPGWQQAYFIGAARTARDVVFKPASRDPLGRVQTVPPDVARAAIFVGIDQRGDDRATVTVHMPANRSGWFGEDWHIVVAACTADHRMIGYGTVTVSVAPLGLSRALTFAGLLALWLLAAFVAARENRRKLHEWWLRIGGAPTAARATWRTALKPENRTRVLCKGLRAMDPVFISQDAYGAGSLGRLQLLVLSFAVIGVVFYVFLRTGAFAGLSNDILALLGITAGGSAFARAAALRRPLTPPQRRILFGSGVVSTTEPMPSLRDVLGGGGELDVTRLQAFAFTGFALVALVVNGVADLAAFTLPAEMLSVLGLSQGVYVVGKLLPAEAEATLRSDMETLRREADAALAAGAQTPAFIQARRTAAESIEGVFAERFRRDDFLQMPPAELA